MSRAGDPLPGGGITPGRHDGTATFDGPHGGLRLVQNHEIGTSDANPTLAAPELTYDPRAKGGTTTLTLDNHLNRVDEYVSLAGTWSQLCRWTHPVGHVAHLRGDRDPGRRDRRSRPWFRVRGRSGHAVEQPRPDAADGAGTLRPRSGRVDPQRGDLYLTEDGSAPNGLVYRFAPNDRSQTYGALRNGGTLTAMSCSLRGTHVPDLSVFSTPGTALTVEWVAVPDPQAQTVSIRRQFANTQITRSRKFEGAWWGDATGNGNGSTPGTGAAIARPRRPTSCARSPDSATARSAEHDGQVWGYDPDDQTLTLELYLPVNPQPASDIPDGPDNICVSPYGGFFLAEDGEGVQHLLAVDTSGAVTPFARNRLSTSEFTGVAFAPGGKVLFANVQDQGICFAITGPFNKLS